MPAKADAKTQLELTKELRKLTKEVKKLKELEFVRVLKHPVKFLVLAFLKGIMVGFGSVLGASVVVGIFVYIMAQISFVPILGDFVEEMIGYVNVSQSSEDDSSAPSIFDQIEETKSEIENGHK